MNTEYTFYQAIELVLTRSKRMRRIGWDSNCKSIFYINSDILNTVHILLETDTVYTAYIPTPDDMIANDWMEV